MDQNTTLEAKLEEANEVIDTLTACCRELYYEAEKIKDEKRIYNVIFRGIPEVDNEKMYETMKEVFNTMQNSFTYIGTHGEIRLGKEPKQQQQNVHPRNPGPSVVTHASSRPWSKGLQTWGIS